MSEEQESDRLAGAPHPRETQALIGREDAERTLREAYAGGRIHHAWILGGTEGSGKATLAYRVAKFVLAHPEPGRLPVGTSLAVAADEPAARQVVARSHPDLAVLRRLWNDKSKSFFANIRADDARGLVRFFGATAGEGGWRIAIVDSADDLAREGANALLKVLEEPPARALFLIVSHQPGRLLPTIRSRCRRLTLPALSAQQVAEAAALARPDLDRAALASAAHLAEGSVRLALTLAEGEGVALHATLEGLLSRLPALDLAAVHALADRCSGKAGEATFALLMAFTEKWLHARLSAEAGAPPARLARWAEVWESLRDAARDVEAFNLERKPLLLSLMSMIARASRS